MEQNIFNKNVNIGWEIRKVMEAKGMTLRTFAAMMNMKESTLRTVLETSNMDLNRLKQFSEKLGVNFFEHYVEGKEGVAQTEEREKALKELELSLGELKKMNAEQLKTIEELKKRNGELEEDRKMLHLVIGKLGMGSA